MGEAVKSAASKLRFVVAGTGTEVGKTHTTSGLAAGLRASRFKVLALKPVETGFGDPERSDAAALAHAAGHPAVRPFFVSPAPVTPMRAATSSRVTLDLAALSRWVNAQQARERPEVTLIETAGGLYSPISPVAGNLELIEALEADAWILVARNRLGVLHDVLVALAAARARSCLPFAVVLNTIEGPPRGDNLEDLARCGVSRVFLDPFETQGPQTLLAALIELIRETSRRLPVPG